LYSFNNFNNSRGRIQWTEVGKGFELDQGVNSLFDNNVSLDISKILNSKPLVDGYEREMNDLNNPNLLLLPFDKNSPFRDEFVNSLIASSTRKQAILASTTPNPFIAGFRGEDGLAFSQKQLSEQRLVQERLLEKAAAMSKDGDLYVLLGNLYLFEDRMEDSIKAVENALKKAKVKSRSQAQLVLGQAHFELENFEEAKIQFRAAARDKDKRIKKTANSWIKYAENEAIRVQNLNLRREFIEKSNAESNKNKS